MLIRTVTAHAFGPLHGQTLTFADGMTVVYGPNESAKSSWHAAVYAGLCGRRRGAGATAVDRLFEARHKPWDRDEWSVSVQILLDDGRRVELRQDLAGRVDCRAIDLDLGTDLTSEIITDGTPDAARWLGLDRRSFAATASIAQASMLSVLKDPAELQEFLQRAADTAGADTTAARALSRLEEFQRERVGLDRANASRPLRRAIVAEQDAARHLAEARARRAAYEQSLLTVEELRVDAARAQHRLRLHEAARLRAGADRLRARADELADLDRRLGGVEPAPAAADDTLANRVSAALATWPESAQLTAPDAATLTATPVSASTVDGGGSTTYVSGSAGAASLGPALVESGPAGEPTGRGSFAPPPPFALEPGALAANGAAPGPANLMPDDARGPGLVAAGGGGLGPGVPALTRGQSAEVAGLPDDALWELARLLELRRDPADPAVKQRIQLARERLTGLEQRRSRGGWLAAGGALALLLAVVAVVLGQPGIGLVGFALAVAAVGAGLLVGRSGAVEPVRAELAEAELAHATAEQVAHDVVAQRRAAEARCAALGLPLDPASLRDFARARSAGGRHDQERQQWQDSLAEQRRRAGDRLLQVLAECGLSAPTPMAAEPLLHQWLRERADRAQRADHDRLLWARRVALLDGRELTAVLAEADAAAAQAVRAEAAFAEDELHAVTTVDDDQLRALRSAAQEASARADEAHGSLTERARTLPPVPEAEEELSRAQAELAGVRELNEILELTKGFLASAQERAHRDIAPVLAASVRRALPAVTQGRYTDVIVDPRTLTVQVCGEQRRWRSADRLSHGTTEQVYLLLRLALADHLVKPGTSCPMLLDDVTVHADAGRVPALLELLREAATERQIVLFTQQEQVLDWARQYLDEPRHGLRELTTVPPG